MTTLQLLTSQKFVSTKEFQTKFADIAKQAKKQLSYFQIMRHGDSVGVFLPNAVWEDILEDLEALDSPKYLKTIQISRQEAQRGQTISLKEIPKELAD